MELVIIPLVTGITEALKPVLKLPGRYNALVAIALTLLFSIYWGQKHGHPIDESLIEGLTLGLGSAGFYSAGVEGVKKKINPPIDDHSE